MLDLEPGLAAIHPDWHAGWAPALPEALRAAVMADGRLGARLGARIVSGEASPLDAAARDAPEAGLYRVYMADPERAARLAGLMARAWALSRTVAGDAVRRLAEAVPVRDLALAVASRTLLDEPSGIAPPALDPATLMADGLRRVRAWASTLPAGLERRVLLTLPHPAFAFPEVVVPDGEAALTVTAALTALRHEAEGLPPCPH